MHTVAGIKLHNIKYKYFFLKMVKSSTGSFVFKFFGSSKQTPPYPDPQN